MGISCPSVGYLTSCTRFQRSAPGRVPHPGRYVLRGALFERRRRLRRLLGFLQAPILSRLRRLKHERLPGRDAVQDRQEARRRGQGEGERWAQGRKQKVQALELERGLQPGVSMVRPNHGRKVG